MPRKLRELRADLRRDGYVIERQRGSHQTWKHPLLPGDIVTLAGADGADAKDYQEKLVRSSRHKLREIQRKQEKNR